MPKNKPHDLRSFFGLHTTPFTRELSVEQRFDLPFFTEVRDALLGVVEERQSCAFIAPSGTGKTALLRAMVAKLPEARYRVHYVKVSSLAKRDMCREIAMAMEVPPAGTYPALLRRLQDCCLMAVDTDGMRPVLIVDDAHEMRPDVLGLLRILTNFEMDSRLVVSILLCGQLSLRKSLRRDVLEDITRRLAHIATLRTLTREESSRYVDHRCCIAGARRDLFASSAIEGLYEICRGNMRAIDQIALKALQIAHGVGADVVDSTHVAKARGILWL